MTNDRLQGQRGRPRKEISGDGALINQALQRRRERMRKAQQALRIRQQESKIVQEQKITTLEDMIEQMSSIFGDFADSLLDSEILRKDENSLNKLHATMNLFITVARRAEGLVSDETSYIETVPASPDHTNTSIVAHNQEMSLYASETLQILDDHTSAEWRNTYQSSRVLTDPDLAQFSSTAIPHLLPSSNGFGNGWPSQIPTPAVSSRRSSLSTQLKRPNEHSVTLKILQSTLNIAYYSLLHDFHNPDAISRRMFRYALLSHSREELLFNLRWFLGPGSLEMHHLGHASYGDISGNIDRPDLVSNRLLRPEVDFFVEEMHTSPYLNASDIEEYLHRKGAKFLDAHTIEISSKLLDLPTHSSVSTINARSETKDLLHNNSNSSTKQLATADQNMENPPLMPPQTLSDMFSFNAVMGDSCTNHQVQAKSNSQQHISLRAAHSQPDPECYIIQVSTLMQALAEVSLCLGMGPGYERALIDEAINASCWKKRSSVDYSQPELWMMQGKNMTLIP